MAYDDVCGGDPYRFLHGSGDDRGRCLRYIGRRCGKEGQEEMNRKNEFKIFMEHHVCDVSAVADRLDELGYFSAPASAGHHGNTDGGLYDHSKMVTLELLDLTEKLELKWVRPESPCIVGMFHDVCKADGYRREAEGKWVYNSDVLLPGHGEKSVIITQNILGALTPEEIMCIRWHMGAFDERENWKYYSAAVKKYPNVLYTHVADMTASQIIGV